MISRLEISDMLGRDLIPQFENRIRIILCPEVKFVDVEHTSVKHASFVHRT
jgi:hypothetical protein